MMTNFVDAASKQYLICPLRNCKIAMQNSVLQPLFSQHIENCKFQEFVFTPAVNIIECPLGHILTTDKLEHHSICKVVAEPKFRQLYPDLVTILSAYSVLPFGVNEKFESLHDIHKLTFNISSTQEQIISARQTFFSLLQKSVNHVQNMSQLSRLNCINCCSRLKLPVVNTFKPIQIHRHEAKDSSNETLNPPTVPMNPDSYIQGFQMNLLN